MKERLKLFLVSLGFLFAGCVFILFEVLTPESMIIFWLFFVVPIPLIAIAIVFVAIGTLGVVVSISGKIKA